MANDLTQFLAQEESSGGTDPAARRINPAGTGRFQLGEKLYLDIQKEFPQFKDIPYERAALEAGLDKQVADAGIQVIQKQLAAKGVAPTPALIATAWQQGASRIGKVVRKVSARGGGSIMQELGTLGQRRLSRATKALASPQGVR